ncbi:MAG: hypothetical protein BWZ10_02810 [candidate division BRC1 bacterium ADurb.BinA364]|nr:MAG: hypothetical protein BWZ10_02810 [candidate division BRC1 bacterium ADurb.BinA364]
MAEMERFARLMAIGDAQALSAEAETFLRNRPQSPYADEARALRAVAERMRGRPEQARALEDDAIASQPDSNMARHIGNARRSAAASADAAYQTARAAHHASVWRYIGFGERPAEERIESYAAGQGLPTLSWIDRMAPLFILGSVARSIGVAIGRGPSNAAVRDAAERLRQEDLNAPRAQQLSLWLAKQAKSRGAYEQSERYYADAGADLEAARAKLRQMAARDWISRASVIEDAAEREKAYEAIAREYAETKYAERARDQAIKAVQARGAKIGKAELAATPALWNGRGLRWSAELFDGRSDNGELGDDGVEFLPPDWSEAQFVLLRDGRRSPQRVRLEGQAHQEILAALNERKLAETRDTAADEADQRRILPLEIHGSFGSAGLLVYPSLMPYKMKPEEEALYR